MHAAQKSNAVRVGRYQERAQLAPATELPANGGRGAQTIRLRGGAKTVQKLTPNPAIDFEVQNHGTIFLLCPLTDSAIAWVDEHIGQDNGYQPYWPTVVIEHRYIADLVAGIQRDGLAVR